MKTIVLLVVCLLHITVANTNHELKIVDNHDKYKTYQLDLPGKEPITVFEKRPLKEDSRNKWDIVETTQENDDEIKNLMTHIIHDIHNDKPRCYGPSCQEGFIEDEGPQEHLEDYELDNEDKLKDFQDYPNERLQAIAALAAKLKKLKNKSDRYSSSSQDYENDDKVLTSWNRLKVKQHKHPYDDKDGWVTLEPVAWSTSKVSKWKPNVKKHKPSHWNEDEDTKFSNDDRFTSYHDSENSYVYPQKRPSMTRPGYINNKLYMPQEFESELPSKPSWTKNKPQQNMQSFHSSWSSDDSRRPYKPNCDKDADYPSDDSIYYGMSDSLVTDNRPANFPFEYEALHQASSQKRPLRRPTQVVYADSPDYHSDHSRPPYGDGKWVLLSTTKGYRNKKRQRSLSSSEENFEVPSITSHQAVSLTVLPVDENSQTNMTTSHGGMLEVEKSFQTVEESKRDMDLKNDLEASASQQHPVRKVIRRKVVGNKNTPDSSTVLAAVGAGMVPATMAMVVPMMLGRRRRRDLNYTPQFMHLNHILHTN